MAERNTAIFGMYTDRIAAKEAADAFLRAGFRSTDLSMLNPENDGTKDLAHEKHTKAPEGAAIGFIVGGVVGALASWFLSTGMVAVPYAGPLIAAGLIVSALAGLGAGALAGVLIGALAGAAIPEYEAIRYRGRVRNRGVLFSVHCDNGTWLKRARKLLADTGSTHVAARREAKGDFGASDKPHHRRLSAEPGIAESAADSTASDYPTVGSGATARGTSGR